MPAFKYDIFFNSYRLHKINKTAPGKNQDRKIRKGTWTGKICSDITHGKGKPTRQRHSCRPCMLASVKAMVADGIEPTQIVRRITHEFRNYFCPFCLDAHKHAFATTNAKIFGVIKSRCKLHAQINAQKKCPCGVLWQYCTKCEDYRAGTIVPSRRAQLCPPLPPKKTAAAVIIAEYKPVAVSEAASTAAVIISEYKPVAVTEATSTEKIAIANLLS